MADAGNTLTGWTTTQIDEANAAEHRRALEAYFAPKQPQTMQKKRGAHGETLIFLVGVPLLAGAIIYCFTNGKTLLGIILIPFLVFAAVLLAVMLKGKNAQEAPAAPSGPSLAELDEAAPDFPLEAQIPGDGTRFGRTHLFLRDERRIYPYTGLQQVYVQELQGRDGICARTLMAKPRTGAAVTLAIAGDSPQDTELIESLVQRIVIANPQVQIGA